jgi:hypothetical protein
MAKINVKDTEVTVIQINNEDYISISDMINPKTANFSSQVSCEKYTGIWEQVYNPNFNCVEFALIKNQLPFF